jgi:primosomal protein N' (replication factor Y)
VLKADRRDVLASALREMLVAVDREEIPRRAVIVDVDPMHLM